jgi:hypothetical protein
MARTISLIAGDAEVLCIAISHNTEGSLHYGEAVREFETKSRVGGKIP